MRTFIQWLTFVCFILLCIYARESHCTPEQHYTNMLICILYGGTTLQLICLGEQINGKKQ